PSLSATRMAQNPSGSLSPALSGAHAGGVAGTTGRDRAPTNGRPLAAAKVSAKAVRITDHHPATEAFKIIRPAVVSAYRLPRPPPNFPAPYDQLSVHLHDAKPPKGGSAHPGDPQGHLSRVLSWGENWSSGLERCRKIDAAPHHGWGR